MKKIQCSRMASLLGQLCNPIRMNIICILSDGECNVNEIVEFTGAKLSNISQHLKLMELAGFIKKRKEGKHVYCSIKNKNITKLLECMETVFK